MDDAVEGLKLWARVAGVFVALALIGAGLWASLTDDPGAGPDIAPAAIAQVDAFAQRHAAALPRILPDGATTVRGRLVADLAVVVFGARGEPDIVVCTGTAGACRAALPRGRPVARRTADGPASVLTIGDGRTEEPPALSARAREFWSAVPLAQERPDWLDTASRG